MNWTDAPESRADIEVAEAIAALPWVDQLCPLMRHQYAVLGKSPSWAWYALDATIRDSPDSYLAYFRGYQRPESYWDGSDGLRYWRTRFELNRCTRDSVELPPRVDDGAQPVLNWIEAPHAPNGAGLYSRDARGTRLPHERFFDAGYEACRACSRAVSLRARGWLNAQRRDQGL
jgi:hypothetical protein